MKRRSRPTISDVARVAGVAPMTVSRVLTGSARVKESTADRVRNAVQMLQYETNELARELRWGPGKSFGLVLPRLTDPFAMVYARAVYGCAEERGRSVVLFTSDGDAAKERSLVNRAAQRGIRGLVLIPTDASTLLTRRDAEALHLVTLHRPLPALLVDSVLPQDRQGSRLAVEHLLGHGISRILFVSLAPNFSVLRERVEGYRDAMEVAALHTCILEAKTEAELGVLLAAQFEANSEGEIGVVTEDTSSTLAFLRTRWQRKAEDRERIRLVALDDFPTSDLMNPPLTTVRQPLEEMGLLAVEMLLTRMGNDEEPATAPWSVSIPVELIVRESCGCARGARASDSVEQLGAVRRTSRGLGATAFA